VLLPM
jgi:iron complex transport system permease protein